MTKCIVVRNPASRRSLSTERLDAALEHAREAGWQIDVVETAHEGHATEIARAAAASGIDVVIVNGGDGTINEVVNGIAHSAVALAVIRGGTANVWAGEIGTSNDPAEAVRDIVHGVRRRIDLGRVDARYFLLMAGIGLDAEIVPRVAPRAKRWTGRVAYVVAGIIEAIRTRPWTVRERVDGEPRETSLYWMLIGNTRSYGGITRITLHAVADDGQLDVALMHHGGPFHLIADGVRLFLGKHERSPNIEYRLAKVVELLTPGLPVHVDGELVGETPMTFEIAPLALDVIVPPSLESPLFSAPPVAAVSAPGSETPAH